MFATFPLRQGAARAPSTVTATALHVVVIAALVLLVRDQPLQGGAPRRDVVIDFPASVGPPSMTANRSTGEPGASGAAVLPALPGTGNLPAVPDVGPVAVPDARPGAAVPGVAALLGIGTTGAAQEGVPFARTIVDEPASPIVPARPEYPAQRASLPLEGRVTAEFIIDTSGVVEQGSVRIVASTHEAFARAVLEALPQARFRPGRLSGQPVRQLVRQDFRFTR